MKCLLIDDHVLFRDGLKFLLSDIDEHITFYETSSADEAIEKITEGEIELILLDYHMPGTDGMSGLELIKNHFDTASVVVLSSEDNPRVIRQSVENGASGFIPKSSSSEVMLAALKLIMAGDTYLPAFALTNVDHEELGKQSVQAQANPLDKLTNRQAEVLRMAILGKVNKVIAREMFISEGTVKAHLSAAFRALGVHNRTEAVYVAAKYGMKATIAKTEETDAAIN